MAYRYLLFYKPYNVLSQFTDTAANTSGSRAEQGAVDGLNEKPSRATLKDYVSVPDVYAVGRLDRDSEGLLLLTDDGPMQHRLSHPKFEHKRQYWVQVEGVPDQAALTRLQKGISLRDYQTRPAQVRAISEPALPPRNPPIRYRRQIPTAWLELTLTEGKNRQVRRMTAAVGFPTLRLVRSALFLQSELALTLDALQPGEWRELTAKERRSLPSR